MSDQGKPLFENLRYCVRCLRPETEEGITFDKNGICPACRSSEQKMHIDWKEREKELRNILEEARAKSGSNYDCIVPISGGKDSTFQLHVLTQVYKVKPLAVTFSHNWFSETGYYNLLLCLEAFNVDHIMFTPNRDLVGRLAKRSLHGIGDACWHCHAGVGAFPLQVAVNFNIPLIVYGESMAEGTGRATYLKPVKYDRDYFTRFSARLTPQQMVCEYLTEKDMHPFGLPSAEECERVGVQGIHLGNYIFWDEERQMELVRDTYGWRETEVEGAYKGFKSAECVMPGMHDFTCYLKRGYGRSTYQACYDVRSGVLTREEGFDLIREHDPVKPESLAYFCEITGMTEEEVYQVMRQKHRLPQLKDTDLPIVERTEPCRERIRPFAQQILERLRPPAQRIELVPQDPGEGAPGKPGGFLSLSLERIVQGLVDEDFGPQDVVQTCIDQVARLEAKYQAWEAFNPEKLLFRAEEVEKRLLEGQTPGLLEGAPIGIKDIFNTVDYPTQMGSPLWAGFTPGNDARAVFHVLRAGGLVAGKTVTAEFAVHALGKTLNPHDPSRNPGTSSSGSAVAVALGMVPAALGTQTAASIVRPASFSGVYGMKPSFGLIPRTGVLKTTDTLDTLGFFVGQARDLERVWQAMAVHGPNYPKSHLALTDKARQKKPAGRPWRVGLARTAVWDLAEGYAREALLEWMDRLARDDGVEVVEAALPPGMDKAHEVHRIIYNRCLAYYFQDEYKRSELVSPVMNELIEDGLKVTAEMYDQNEAEQVRLIAAMDEYLKNFDVIISLATAGEAPLREVRETPDPGLMWTLTYLPVVSVPAFVSPRGLPFGLQVAARRYNDPLLISFMEYLRSRGLVPEGPNPLVPEAVA